MISGSCLCGQVHFCISGEIREISNCHCSQCRKAYGSAFGSIAVCASEDFRYLSGSELISAYVQTSNVTRRFCSNCGSNLPIKEDGDPYVGIPAGLLDDDPGPVLSEHIYVGSKAPWLDFSMTGPQYDGASPSSAEKRETATAVDPHISRRTT